MRRSTAAWLVAALALASPAAGESVATMQLVKDPLADQLLAGATGNATRTVLASPEAYRFQVLYGIIDADGHLERHGYRADAEYFFPASSMKVPIVLAAYDRLEVQRRTQPALDRDASMVVYPVAKGDRYTTTLARETWRALIVSDNFSANRLLGLVGHREANETAWSLGLGSVRIHSGFATGEKLDPVEASPRFEFSGPKGNATLPARKSTLKPPATDARDLALGKAYIDGGRRIDRPMSFADKNAIKLQDLQDTLVRIVRPDLAGSPDDLSEEDRAYVKSALGTLPSESGIAGYDRNVVADYPLVPFLRGIERVRPRGHFQIFSKVGQAFGFLVANAYVVDKDSDRAFFLTATIFANPDDVMNDDIYAYDSISFPVLADVGEVFARHAFQAASSAGR